MKKGKKERSHFENDDFFVLRTPLLPMGSLSGLSRECRTAERWRSGCPAAELDSIFKEDCQLVRRRMEKIVSDSTFYEALQVSSPSLVANLRHWRTEPLCRKGAAAERSVLKYITRASTRCTPYGQMAGVAMGDIGDHDTTSLCVGPRDQHRRHARIDAGLLLDMVSNIARDKEWRRRLIYFPNSTLYRLGERFRYVEAEGHPFAERGQLVSVGASDVVAGIVKCADVGAAWDDLVKAILAIHSDVDIEVAEEFVHDLISSQLLVPNIFPSPTGVEALQDLQKRLLAQVPDHPVCRYIDELTAVSAELNSSPIGQGGASLKEAAAISGEWAAARPEPEDELFESEDEEEVVAPEASCRFQIDMALAAPGLRIHGRALRPVKSAMDCLYRINGQTSANYFLPFIEEFLRRYDDRELPLCQVLDPDCGIRFGTAARYDSEPSPLLDVPIPNAGGSAAVAGNSPDQVAKWKSELLVEAAREGVSCLKLSADAILSKFPPPAIEAMSSISILVGAFHEGDAEPESEPSWLLLKAHSAHCLEYMGRFAHVLGPALTHRLRRGAALEQAGSESLLAEVSYLPPARLGNVCQHPPFRETSISYKSPPRQDQGETILVDDLLVSVRSGRIVLRSRKTGTEVSPRLDHMLNVGHITSPAIINFLGMIQDQGIHQDFEWKWGFLSSVSDLPRVSIEGVVVSPRMWTLLPSDFPGVRKSLKKESFEAYGLDLFLAVQRWRRERDVPRWVAVGDMANYIVIDLENPLSVDLFLREIRRKSVIRETFVHERSAAVTGCVGQEFVNEVVLPLWNRDTISRAEGVGFKKSEFGPGDHYHPEIRRSHSVPSLPSKSLRIKDGVLYAKIYGGPSVLDKSLRDELGRLVAELAGSKVIESWYFIRYRDPDFHLRLRLFGSPDKLASVVLPALERVCDRDQNPGIWRLQFDAYEPECDRYGGRSGMHLAERFFGIDSRTLLPMINLLDMGDDAVGNRSAVGVEARWLLAAVSVDALLEDFGLELNDRLAFTETYGNSLADEFGFGKVQRHSTGKIYRKHLDLLTEAFSSSDTEAIPWLRSVRETMVGRSQLVFAWKKELDVGIEDGSVLKGLGPLVQSYVHMHCNRMFTSQMRRQEAVLLQLLQRHYRSQIGRLSKGWRN